MLEITHIPERGAIITLAHLLPNRSEFSRYKEFEHEGQTWCIVPDTVPDVRLLAKYGLSVKSRILRDYSWSGHYTPFNHQSATADFLVRYPRAFVFNEIGTGKTLSALWACDYLRAQGHIGRVLIVSTLSTLWRVWADDLFKNFTHRSFAVLHGDRRTRQIRLKQEHDFYIINHDGVEVLREELARRKDITHVIVDEGACFRNAKTRRYGALKQIAGPQSGRGVWWMTGSPMPTAPTDIWAQARMVNPGLVPQYFTRFRNQVMVQISQFKWVPKAGWEQQIFSMLKPSVRYIRDECLDLPPCTTETLEVEMTKEQQKAYKEMKDHYVIEMEAGEITAVNEGVKLGKLLQIATGAVYGGDEKVHTLDVKPKLNALIETIYEAGSKVIVFAPFRHSLAQLERELTKKFSVGVVHGGVTANKRGELFSAFQSGPLQILLAHPGTMAHGLTLTASSTVIWWGPVDSYEIYEQAIGRITRPGQKNKQTIIHLICSDIEKRIYKRLGNKQKMQGLLLELLKSA